MKNGTIFNNNYERAVNSFLATCAQEPSNKEYLDTYNLMIQFYSELANFSELLGFNTSPDVYFAPWEHQKGREKDSKTIRDTIKKIDSLVEELFEILDEGTINEQGILINSERKISRNLVKILTKMNIINNKQIILSKNASIGFKTLIQISKEHVVHITDSPIPDKKHLYFSRIVFEPESNWIAKFYDDLLDAKGVLLDLVKELENRGYLRVDVRDGKMITLDYIKEFSKKSEPLKIAWGERTRAGIGLTYEELRLEPGFFWVRMPYFKIVLQNIDKANDIVRKFILDYTKKCNNCGYCLQTDKTGLRPRAYIPIDGQNKCTYYPGFSMNFRYLTKELAASVLEVLKFVESLKDEFNS